jgi:hypothetical protein
MYTYLWKGKLLECGMRKMWEDKTKMDKQVVGMKTGLNWLASWLSY